MYLNFTSKQLIKALESILGHSITSKAASALEVVKNGLGDGVAAEIVHEYHTAIKSNGFAVFKQF
jgi:hypothetical protein